MKQVFISHHLITYRESIAGVVRQLRPDVAIHVLTPAELAAGLTKGAPDLVIGDALPALGHVDRLAWIAMYPGGADRADYCIGGDRGTLARIGLPELDALLERGLAGRASG